MDYEPADPNYGADADGNRGMYVAGYWSGSCDDSCSEGHTLTADEQEQVNTEAAADFTAEDEAENEQDWWPEHDDD